MQLSEAVMGTVVSLAIREAAATTTATTETPADSAAEPPAAEASRLADGAAIDPAAAGPSPCCTTSTRCSAPGSRTAP